MIRLLSLLVAFSFLFLTSYFVLPTSSFAGGPINTSTLGEPSFWAMPLSLHVEGGVCGDFTNAEMIDRIEENLSVWEDASSGNVTFSLVQNQLIGTTIDAGDDVNGDNYEEIFVNSSSDPGLNDSLNPLVFDNDGTITDAVFGTCAHFSTLGFAGPDGYVEDDFHQIGDGQAYFNCRCLQGNSNGPCIITPSCADILNDAGNSVTAGQLVVHSDDDNKMVIRHEVGHLLGLDHTQVNQTMADGSCSSLDSDADGGGGDCDDVPLMYPEAVDAPDQITAARDDEVAILATYGLSDLQNSGCTVTGTLIDADGSEMRCADVQATATNGDTSETISFISGYYAPYSGSREFDTTSDEGDFSLFGLDPAVNYTIKVVPIDANWISGSSVGPCASAQPTDIDEETIATLTNGVLRDADNNTIGTCSVGSAVVMGNIQTLSDPTYASSSSSSSGGSSSSTSSSSGGCRLIWANSANKDTQGSFWLIGFLGFALVVFLRVRQVNRCR